MTAELDEFDYLAYLESDRWQLQRMAALARADSCCSRCGVSVGLEVHHRTYGRLGDELPEDLEVLCSKCHKAHHKRENAQRLYDARLNGWASKRYGEDWADDPFFAEEMKNLFDDWLWDRGA